MLAMRISRWRGIMGWWWWWTAHHDFWMMLWVLRIMRVVSRRRRRLVVKITVTSTPAMAHRRTVGRMMKGTFV